jgi:hypothetical protein
LDAAVAYVTAQGVHRLASRLASPRWASAAKRWLVSIDFGITEPAGLEALRDLPASEVRVVDGLEVVSSPGFRPRRTFHAKLYAFRASGAELSLCVGSANLTLSALTIGAETMTVTSWQSPISSPDRRLRRDHDDVLVWFEQLWATASPVDVVLPAYRSRFSKRRMPEALRDDKLAEELGYGPEEVEIPGELASQLAMATALWFEVHQLYANRGAGVPGNQLDTPKGTRVFFGFPSTTVARNTVLGHVRIRFGGGLPVERSVRFGNNQMDKVNLPVPGNGGPPTYDNQFLVFERAGVWTDGLPLFRLAVMDEPSLLALRAGSNHSIDLEMSGGRRYGLLF